ncbi:hypothetical protein FACS1894127_5730 [Clostridia bacterium]|nr:hypothetical protein FACS1894127_5730 [Clostridia bacterium]
MSKKLVLVDSDPPEDFEVLALDMQTQRMCGLTEYTGYETVLDIPHNYVQYCLTDVGLIHMSLAEIYSRKMTRAGDILTLKAIIPALLVTMDPKVAAPLVDSMQRKTDEELNFEPFTAAGEHRQILRQGWGYYDPVSGTRAVWVSATQECGDPSWVPGGAGYSNWRIIPLLKDDGLPVWAMGVYTKAGSIWHYQDSTFVSLVDQEPSVFEPGSAASVWEEVEVETAPPERPEEIT